MLVASCNSHARCDAPITPLASLVMARPRLLTDPDEIAASDEFKRLVDAQRALGRTQEQIAAEIGDGVSQGTIWQWANRRLAIPANRAKSAADAVGGQPGAISVAWRTMSSDFIGGAPSSRVSEPRTSYASQNLGINLGIITDAMLVVKAFVEDKGLPAERATDPVLIKHAIDVVSAAAEALDLSNVITFKRRLEERVGADGRADDSGEVAAAG